MSAGADKVMAGEIPQLLERLDGELSELEMALGSHHDQINPILGFDQDSPEAPTPEPSQVFGSALGGTLDGYVGRVRGVRRRLTDLTSRAQV